VLRTDSLGGPVSTARQGETEHPDDVTELSSFFIEVLFTSVSDAIAAEGASRALGEHPDVKDLRLRLAEALDADLATSLNQSKGTPKGYPPVVRLLKLWNKKSSDARRLLIEHVVDATLDPLIWRTAQEDIGPRPNVSMRLVVPGSYAAATSIEPPQDVDLAVVFRGSPRAAEEVDDLTAAMTPDVPVPTPPVVLQARRNAQARASMLEEFGALTAAEVADLAGSEAKNTSALAGRWRREGRLLAVEHHGTLYYPGFQFDSAGKLKPVIAEVLRYLGLQDVSPWQQALWFTTANGWLRGRRPVDILDDEHNAVVSAAREALREPVG
jgi:hypothetical protein